MMINENEEIKIINEDAPPKESEINKSDIHDYNKINITSNIDISNDFSLFNNKHLICPTCKINIIHILSITKETTPCFYYICPSCSTNKPSSIFISDYLSFLSSPFQNPPCVAHPNLTSSFFCPSCYKSLCKNCLQTHNILLPSHIPFISSFPINPLSNPSSQTLWKDMKTLLSEIESLSHLEEFITLQNGKISQFKKTFFSKIDILIEKLFNLKEIITYEIETYTSQTNQLYQLIKVMYDNFYSMKESHCNENLIKSMKSLNFNLKHKYFEQTRMDRISKEVDLIRIEIGNYFDRNSILMMPHVVNVKTWISKVIELPGGNIAAATGDNCICIYDIKEIKEIKKIPLFIKENCYSLCYDEGKERLIIGTDQFNIFGYDIINEKRNIEFMFKYVKENVHCDDIYGIVKLSLECWDNKEDVLYATTSADKSIIIWNEMFIKQYYLIINAHDSIINGIIEYKQESNIFHSYIISIANDCCIKVWKISQKNYMNVSIIKKAHNDEIYGIVELKGKRIATCARDASLKIWNLSKLTNIVCCYSINEAHNDSIYCICKLHDDNLVTCSDDGEMKIWDVVHNCKCIQRIFAHNGEIVGVLQLSTGEIVTYGNDNTIRIWEY